MPFGSFFASIQTVFMLCLFCGRLRVPEAKKVKQSVNLMNTLGFFAKQGEMNTERSFRFIIPYSETVSAPVETEW